MAKCKYGEFPYPEENLFVVGVKRKSETDITNIDTGIYIAKNIELIHHYFSDTVDIISIVSLPQFKAQLALLEKAALAPEKYETIAPSSMLGRIFGHAEPWLLVFAEEHSEIVFVNSAYDLQSWAEKNQKNMMSFVSLSILKQAVAELIAVQTGEDREHAEYIYDIAELEIEASQGMEPTDNFLTLKEQSTFALSPSEKEQWNQEKEQIEAEKTPDEKAAWAENERLILEHLKAKRLKREQEAKHK